jgi:asparagine synthase (glutamine-hydrolysing)
MLGAAAVVPPSAWNKVAGWRSAARPAFFGHKVRRALRTAQDGIGLDDLYQHFLDDWYGEPSPLLGGSTLDRAVFPEAPLDPSSRVMLADALGYLPGDILTKVDRAGMAVSLEGRVPFLDPEVAALAARIPIGMKIDGGKGKAILRRMLAQFVPPALFERPKAGFAIPLADWLTGPLREWCEELLHPHALEDGDLLDARAIRARWDRLVDGREDASQALWSVLMFQAWRCEPPRLRDPNARFAPVAVPAVA